MQLIQLNAWSCKLPTEIIRLFKHERPDIITLQEVISTSQGGKVLDTIEEIFEEYPFAHQYYTPLVQFAFMHTQARRGNLIASTHEFINTSQIWTHGEYDQDFDYVDSHGYNSARNIAHAEVVTPRGNVHVLTLHGYHIKAHKNGDAETLRACEALVRYAQTLDGPIIITGDFNLAPNSESIQLINASFRNLSVEFGFPTTRNHLTTKTEVCDYIFVNDKITVNTAYMSDILASDHNALVLDFELA